MASNTFEIVCITFLCQKLWFYFDAFYKLLLWVWMQSNELNLVHLKWLHIRKNRFVLLYALQQYSPRGFTSATWRIFQWKIFVHKAIHLTVLNYSLKKVRSPEHISTHIQLSTHPSYLQHLFCEYLIFDIQGLVWLNSIRTEHKTSTISLHFFFFITFLFLFCIFTNAAL